MTTKSKPYEIVHTKVSEDDWLRAARLKKKAEAGDKQAAEELERMENTSMVQEVEDENTERLRGDN